MSSVPPKKPPRLQEPDEETTVQKRKLACPYYVRYGESGCTGKACSGDGWDDHRLKEHLLRAHGPTHTCPTCQEPHKTIAALLVHLTREIRCVSVSANARSNHFTEEQKESLKPKRKCGTTPQDEWNRFYKILFPDQLVIPSGYVDDRSLDFARDRELERQLENNLFVEVRKLLAQASWEDASDLDAWLRKAEESAQIQHAVLEAVNPLKRRRASPGPSRHKDKHSRLTSDNTARLVSSTEATGPSNTLRLVDSGPNAHAANSYVLLEPLSTATTISSRVRQPMPDATTMTTLVSPLQLQRQLRKVEDSTLHQDGYIDPQLTCIQSSGEFSSFDYDRSGETFYFDPMLASENLTSFDSLGESES